MQKVNFAKQNSGRPNNGNAFIFILFKHEHSNCAYNGAVTWAFKLCVCNGAVTWSRTMIFDLSWRTVQRRVCKFWSKKLCNDTCKTLMCVFTPLFVCLFTWSGMLWVKDLTVSDVCVKLHDRLASQTRLWMSSIWKESLASTDKWWFVALGFSLWEFSSLTLL